MYLEGVAKKRKEKVIRQFAKRKPKLSVYFLRKVLNAGLFIQSITEARTVFT